MIISGITYQKQKDPDYCVPACASMILGKFGINVTQEKIGDAVMKINTEDNRRRTITSDICSYLVQHDVWPIVFSGMPDELAWKTLIDYIENKNPVMVSQQFNENTPSGHYRIVIGSDIVGKFATEIIYYHDPLIGPYQDMKKETFMKLWKPTGSTGSDIRIKNEMIILQKSPSDIMKKTCLACNSNNIVKYILDTEKGLPNYHLINPNAKIEKNGVKYSCESCESITMHYGS